MYLEKVEPDIFANGSQRVREREGPMRCLAHLECLSGIVFRVLEFCRSDTESWHACNELVVSLVGYVPGFVGFSASGWRDARSRRSDQLAADICRKKGVSGAHVGLSRIGTISVRFRLT